MFIVEPVTLVIPHKLDDRADWLESPQQEEDLAIRLTCPECRDLYPNIEVEFSTGDVVCRGCGLVFINRIVDTRPQWRTYDNDRKEEEPQQNKTQVQQDQEHEPKQKQNPSNEGEEERWSDDDFNTVSHDNRDTAHSDKKHTKPSQSPANLPQRPRVVTFPQIQSICDLHSLPQSVSNTAGLLYQRYHKEKLLRGKGPDAVIAACIFIACRATAVHRTFKEIADLTNIPRRQIAECYKALKVALNRLAAFNKEAGSNALIESDTALPFVHDMERNTIIYSLNEAEATNWTKSENLLLRYSESLRLPLRLRAYCDDIAYRVRDLDIASGRSPALVAAGIIHFACKLLDCVILVSDIAKTAGVSTHAIQVVYQLLIDHCEALAGPEVENLNMPNLKGRGTTKSKRPTINPPKQDFSRPSFHDRLV